MTLLLHNSRTRQKEAFEPLVPGRVSIYVCGPTVYDHPHLGHARASVAFDIIRRTLEATGNKVTYVQNITDVDDKIINKAAEEGVSPEEIAERYTRSYEEMMARIGVRAPSITPKATGHITDMIDLIARLIEHEYAYALDNGDVYFAVDKHEGYGSLSNRSLEDMRAGERVEADDRKRHPMDFALWKSAKEWQISWPAPWGAGRPGWHIECSAMSMRYLGETFDIHGGGADLLFPHHENEAAQSEALTGVPLARYWLHNGFVTLNDEKMSKSTKNFMSLSDVLEVQPPPVVRTLLAGSHYRSQLEMNEEVLTEARAVWERFRGYARNAGEQTGDVDPTWRARFFEAMEDDFNTPVAFAVLHEIINTGDNALLPTFSALAGVLGLDPIGDWPEDKANGQVAPLVEYLVSARAEARASKDFTRADQIRDALTAAGIIVEDRADGARWYLEDPWRR